MFEVIITEFQGEKLRLVRKYFNYLERSIITKQDAIEMSEYYIKNKKEMLFSELTSYKQREQATISKVVEEVKEFVEEVKTDVVEEVKEFVEEVKEFVEEVKTDFVEEVKEFVKETTEAVKEDVTEFVEEVKEIFEPVKEEVKEEVVSKKKGKK